MTSEIIVSVPHTGTRFLKERLGITDHVHTHTNWVSLETKIHNRPVITPLRNPVSVWRSWCRRRGEESPLIWAPHFFAAWYVLHALDQLRDIDFICIDRQEDKRIEDWSPVGGEDKSHARWKLHKTDLRIIYKLPFVKRYYGSQP